MKVLLVFDSLSPFSGGSQNAVLMWFDNLKKLGVKVKLLTDQNYKLIEQKLDPDELIINPSYSLGSLFSGFSFSPFLHEKSKKQIVDFSPDIVHIHEQLLVSYQVLSFVKKKGYQTLTSMHGDPYKFRAKNFPFSLFIKEGSIFNRLLRAYQFFILKNSNYVTVPSKQYQKIISEKLTIKPFILPSPVSSYFFNKKISKPVRIDKLVTMSRLAGEKHVDVLIDMMVYLKDKYTLTILGEGIDKKYLVEKVKKLGLDKIITFYGWLTRPELSRILRDHQIFLSASNFETFGLTYIEALASHLPLVVFDYPVSREIIPEGMADFVKSLNPKDWADALIKIQDNQNIYFKMFKTIENNYQNIYQYNELESAKILLKIYENISHHPHP